MKRVRGNPAVGNNVPRRSDLIQTGVVAEMLGETRFTVWRWRKAGILPAPIISGPGAHPRWRRADIETFLRGGTTGGDS